MSSLTSDGQEMCTVNSDVINKQRQKNNSSLFYDSKHFALTRLDLFTNSEHVSLYAQYVYLCNTDRSSGVRFQQAQQPMKNKVPHS